MRTSNWKQGILLGGSFLLACFVAYLLWRDYQEDAAIGRGATPVAYIRTSEGDVRRRPGDRFRWFKIGLNKGLFSSDSISTGEKAQAELAFPDGTILKVTENTLFTVEKRPDGAVAIQLASGLLSFRRGSAQRKSTNAAPPRIQAHGKKLDISEAEGQIAVSDKHVALEVNRGKVSLEHGSRIATVEAGRGLEAKIDGTMQIADLPPEPPPAPSPSPYPAESAPAKAVVPLPSIGIAPALDEHVPKENHLEPGPLDLELTWDPVPEARSYAIVLSATSDFTGSLAKVETKTTSRVLKGEAFGSKRYYFKLLARFVHGREESSLVGDIDFRFRGPVLAAPSDNLVVKPNSPVLFTWSRILGVPWYFLEISQDPQFNRVVQKTFAEINFQVLDTPKAGTYWWRVRAVRSPTISDALPAHRLGVEP